MYFDDISTCDDLYSRNYMLILNYDPILLSGIWLKLHIFKGLSYVGMWLGNDWIGDQNQ